MADFRLRTLAEMQILDPFLDGVTGAGLFGKLNWPGALPPLTHSGLGSCGFFGPASFLLIPGALLFVAGCGLLLVALCDLLLRTASDFFHRQHLDTHETIK